MTGPNGMGPLRPVGLTAADIMDQALWYSQLADFTAEDPPMWFSYTEAIAHDEYNTGWGPLYVTAWTDEYTGMEWPTFAQAVADDAKLHLGDYWFQAYWAQSSQPSYDDMVGELTGFLWYSALDELSTSVDAPPSGDASSVTYGGDDYLLFTATGSFWSGKVTGTLTLDEVCCVGGGATGGRSAVAGNHAAGGGGSGDVTITTSVVVTASRTTVTCGPGGTAPGASNTQGADGSATTFGALASANGGSGGGTGNVASGVGKTGQGSGGGGAVGDSTGNGGAGSGTNGHAGGNGGGAEGGGGGGAGGNGQSGTGSAQRKHGGVGMEYPTGSGVYYAAGGQGGARFAAVGSPPNGTSQPGAGGNGSFEGGGVGNGYTGACIVKI